MEGEEAMREILFRGKLIDGAGWVYGDLVHDKKPDGTYDAYIMGETATDVLKEGYPVIPETVGQYTGLKDKNGKRIFDGDVVESDIMKKVYNDMIFAHGFVLKGKPFIGVVLWFNEYTTYAVRYGGKSGLLIFSSLNIIEGEEETTTTKTMDKDDLIIIGNIHDNKELLK